MACCGQRRQQISRTTPIQRPNSPARPASVNRAVAPSRTVAFQYVGKTALTAVGLVSAGEWIKGRSGIPTHIALGIVAIVLVSSVLISLMRSQPTSKDH